MNINLIINNSIKKYYKEINKTFLIKEDLLEERYTINIVKKCIKKDCKKYVINSKDYCKKHYEEIIKEENKNIDFNLNIKDNFLKKIDENTFEDIFGVIYKKVSDNEIKIDL